MTDGDKPPGYVLEHSQHEGGRLELRLSGPLRLAEAARLWRETSRLVRRSATAVVFDLSGVEQTDGAAMALLVELATELESRQVPVTIAGARGGVERILALYRAGAKRPRARSKPVGLLTRTGLITAEWAREVQGVLGFVGSFVISLLGIVRRPRTANWRDISPNMERTGADGVPIVLLINFLVGLVMAFQGAVQLKQFGANLFVADLVALSICRELGPLMTAIIICGRSGAAFAAELGTMRVNEEIDALRTMGFDPMRFLVFPKAMALVLVMPLLTLLADLVAILGGLLVGLLGLDLTVSGYLIRTQQALDAGDVFSGVGKSVVFGLIIALIACQQGLAASGGAQGVGRRTTSAVVAILFALIVADAAFTVVMTIFDL